MNRHSTPSSSVEVSLLTGGGDRPYAFGLTKGLADHGVRLDVIVSDELDEPSLRALPNVTLLNLRGSARSDVSAVTKAGRVLRYYARLLAYAAKAKPQIFHILWNNRFEWFDRSLLMLYYRVLGKKTVLTLHNVNTKRRDGRDSLINRVTLQTQYGLADHIFVHTDKMRQELIQEFGVPDSRITVIPFGINNSVPITDLSSEQAKRHLGIQTDEKTILFYGNIAPYKGLEYLVAAFTQVADGNNRFRLIIAGRPKNCQEYWAKIEKTIRRYVQDGRIIVRAEFIPDHETEAYFKAADVLVLPYTYIYQSGVLFLAYSFGLPVIASDVGSLRHDIVEGETGFVFRAEDIRALQHAIESYFRSELYTNLNEHRPRIAAHASERNSWNTIAPVIVERYSDLLRSNRGAPSTDPSISSFEMKTP